MPGPGGLEILEAVRASRPTLPVIILTAKGDEGDRVDGLRLGADDYVVKPFSVRELLARVEAVLRRSAERPVDLVAPGKSVVSLRNPGSSADLGYPEAVVEERFFVGSGTSQAAAVVSGAAALVIEQRPDITPDEVKALLKATAQPIPGVSEECQGAGLIDLKVARDTRTPNRATQKHDSGDGSGLIDAARGSDRVQMDGVELVGDQDIMGSAWDGYSQVETECWTEKVRGSETTVCDDVVTAVDTLWDGGDFNGTSWSGTSWSGTSWSGTSWSGTSWSGTSWSGTSWSGTSWSDQYWNGTSWSGTSWSGTSWSGTSWSGTSWSNGTWLGLSWG